MELSRCAPDGPEHYGSTDSSVTGKPWNGAASRFTDEQYQRASAACDAGDGTVKQRCFLPHHEPDGTTNRNGVTAAAQRVGSLKGHSASAVATAKAHLRSHYKQIGLDPPDSIAAGQEEHAHITTTETEPTETDADRELAAQFGGLHSSFTGTHSHPHSAYRSQGGDETHDHSHDHAGDNLHRHDHGTTAAGVTASAVAAIGPGSFMMRPPEGKETWWDGVIEGMAFAASGKIDRDPMLGSKWAVSQAGPDEFHLLTAGGVPWTTEPLSTYTEALEVLALQLADDGDTRATLADGWRSEMAFEGVSTGDGRFIDPGAIEYRSTPLPLMLQTETEPGHLGAVLAGSIDQTGKLGQVAIGAGSYDATDAGRQAFSIVEARGRFGVSIDVAEAEGVPICTTHGGPPGEDCDYDCDIEAHFSLIRVMGLTMTPFPAFEDAYIENAAPASADRGGQEPAVAVAADAHPGEDGCVECAEQMAEGMSAIADTEPAVAITAAGAPAVTSEAPPPAAWFDNPGFHVGDSRLARQPNGHYACPLTVEEPDEAGRRRVYGHMASWFSCHTGIRNQCVTPPRSRTGYAAFNLRPVMTEDGTIVHAGHLTMGIGHADTDPTMSVAEVKDHYDGGPGAITMSMVRMGEDDFGPWFAGYVPPGRTDEQVRAFSACSVSGDWREVWRGKGLDCVACLAGVFVPGFPIAAAASLSPALIAAAGGDRKPEVRVGWRGDTPVALVAAGAIRQPEPWERMLAAAAGRIAALEERLDAAERTIGPLRPIAARELMAAAGVPDEPTQQ
ncbi:MAG: hypothetical protein ACRDXE_10695 [Acidimicrobiales bacterium]